MYRNLSFLMPQNYKYDCSVLWLRRCGLMWYRRLLFPKETALQCYTFILSLFSNIIYFHKLPDSGNTKGVHAEIIFLPPFVFFFPQAARWRFLTQLSRGNFVHVLIHPTAGMGGLYVMLLERSPLRFNHIPLPGLACFVFSTDTPYSTMNLTCFYTLMTI